MTKKTEAVLNEDDIAAGMKALSSDPQPKKEDVLEQESLFAQAMSDPSQMKTVGEYIKTGRRWDVTHKDLVGKLLILQRCKAITTRYGEAMLVDIDVGGRQKTALFGGTVLIDQVKELEVNLPVCAVIRKPARAYALFSPSPEQIQEYKDKYLA